jgi:hypothetical protein
MVGMDEIVYKEFLSLSRDAAIDIEIIFNKLVLCQVLSIR